MTIGIGVLCSTQPKPYQPRPDTVILISDTMGSTDTDSHDDLRKMFLTPELGLYSVGADVMESCAELHDLVVREVQAIAGPRIHSTIRNALVTAMHKHRSDRFRQDVLVPKYMVAGTQIPIQEHTNIMTDWQRYDAGGHLLVGVFDDEGKALLYLLQKCPDEPSTVHTCAYPGHYSIGTGSYNANMWLNYRGQTLALNQKRSTLHAYEASLMAASAPTVNQNIEVLMATKEKSYYFSALVSKTVVTPGQRRC